MSQLDVETHHPVGEVVICSLSKMSLKAVSFESLCKYVLISLAPKMRNLITVTEQKKFNNCCCKAMPKSLQMPISITFILSLKVQVRTHELSLGRSSCEQGRFLWSFSPCHLQFRKVPKRGESCFLFNSSLTLGRV